jgi:hypothetical protein
VPHYEDETIALLALGETDSAHDGGAHLSTCAQCRDNVVELTAVVSMGRQLKPGDSAVSPPAAVWSRIVDELALNGGQATQSPVEQNVAPATVGAQVVTLDSKRGSSRTSRILSLGVAAAIGLIAGAGGTWALGRTSSQVAPVASVQVATASLDALDIPDTSGTAVLQVQSPNQRAITVNVSNLPLETGKFYEVWLMDPSDQHLVALGVLGVDGRGAYVVPAGLDLSQYTAIDVSLQPMNGSPLHSAVSAVRGIMKA